MIDIRSDLTHILYDLASRERRTVQQQGAWLLEQELLRVARSPVPASPPMAMPDPDTEEAV
jgi:hypothetical protein